MIYRRLTINKIPELSTWYSYVVTKTLGLLSYKQLISERGKSMKDVQNDSGIVRYPGLLVPAFDNQESRRFLLDIWYDINSRCLLFNKQND